MNKPTQVKAQQPTVMNKAAERAQAKKNLLAREIVKNNENFTPEQILELFDAFQSFIDPRSKLMNIESLISCSSTLGLDQKNPTIIKILKSIQEKEAQGEIELNFETFLTELTLGLGNARTPEGRATLFKLIDADQKNAITIDNLRELAKEVGHIIPEDDLIEIAENMSKNETITFEEFEKYMARKVSEKQDL